jgi:hypothetical protein
MKNMRFLVALLLLCLTVTSAQDTQVITTRRRSGGPAVASLVTSNGAAANSVTLTGVQVGDLVVCAVQNDSLTTSGTMSDGTSSLTPLAQFNSGSAPGNQFFYILSSVASGSVTYTPSLTGSIQECFEFHVTGGKTWHFDADNQNGVGGGTSVTTGNITTTGGNNLEAVVFVNKLKNIASSVSNPLIDGITPIEPSWSPIGGANQHEYYLIPTTGSFTGQGTLTYGTSTNWVAGIIAFKAS